MGTGASATHANSAAYGSGATTTRANQQVFGTASNTYTMSGITSAASAAAQSGPAQLVTSDASGNLATTSISGLGLASSADIAAINGQIAGINNRLDDLSKESRRGIATAIAMSTAPLPSAIGRTSWTANYGNFRGESAFGGSFAHRLNTPMPLAVTGGYSYGGGNAHGLRMGLQGEW